MRYHLIIPAAGSGRRFAASVPKQYAKLGSSTVIEHALAPFEADVDCASLTVAISADDPRWPAIAARHPNIHAVTGGEQRAHSVRNALRSLASKVGGDDWVFVHDAARPCFTGEDLAKLKYALGDHPVGGLLAVPLADTLKREARVDADARVADASARVETTVDRAGLWRAATPQVFRFGVLLPALDAALDAKKLPTDESQAVEWAGHQPRLVAGRADNLKVTTPDDLSLASAILAARENVVRG
jgi:2-C-methyl-D-erythritol 4-phosphate cytidylyltransferase